MTIENKLSQPPQNIKLPWKVIKEKGQVCPDGVVIGINWDDFVVGASIFIPAINLAELNKQIQIIANEKKIQVKGYDRIEGGKLGMRFWRIL
jgi:hypothetical protein